MEIDYNFFKNKTINDVNLEQLEWIRKNGYINNIVYYGRKFDLLFKEKSNFNNLKLYHKRYTEIILENFENFIETNELNYLNIFITYIHKFYIFISDNFSEFISNKKVIKDFADLFYFHSHLMLLYTKYNNVIKGTRWELWKENLVRDIPENPHIIFQEAIPYAESGEYKKAIDCFENFYEDDEYTKKYIKIYKVKLSILFYILEFAIKIDDKQLVEKKYDDIINYINNYEKNDDQQLWSITYLRSFEAILSYINYTKKYELKNLVDHWGKRAFESNKFFEIGTIPLSLKMTKSVVLNDYLHGELLREPMLKFMYYLDVFGED